MKIKVKKKLLKESAMTYVYAGKSSTDIQKELTQKIVEFLKKIKSDEENKKQITQSAINYLYHVEEAVKKKINIYKQYHDIASQMPKLYQRYIDLYRTASSRFNPYGDQMRAMAEDAYWNAQAKAKKLKKLAKENNVDLDNSNELYILEDCLDLAQGWAKEFERISQEDTSIGKQLPAIKKAGLFSWLGLKESSSMGSGAVQGHVGKKEDLEEMYSSAAIMGSGGGGFPKERSPEGHKRYVRIRFKRQGLQNFKPNRYFRSKDQQLGEKKNADKD